MSASCRCYAIVSICGAGWCFAARLHLHGKISSELSASSGSFGSNASRAGSTRDDDDLALEAEEVLELGCLGKRDHCDCRLMVEERGLSWGVGKKQLSLGQGGSE